MTTTRRRLTILAVTALQGLLFSSLVVWRTAAWAETGWAGLTWFPSFGVSGEQLPETLAAFEGLVLFVVPGSPADLGGLAAGDTLTQVDGVPVAARWKLLELARGKGPGDTAVFERKFQDPVRVVLASPLKRYETLLGIATSLLLGVAFLAISCLVWWAKPRSSTAVLFYLLCSAGSAVFFVWAASELDLPNLRGLEPLGADPYLWAIYAVFVVLILLLTNLLLHLSLIFPKPRPVVGAWPRVFLWLHSAPFLPVVALPPLLAALFLGRRPLGLALLEALLGVALLALVGQLWRAVREAGWRRALGERPWHCQGIVLLAACMAAPLTRLVSDLFFVVALVVAGAVVAVFWFAVVLGYSTLTCLALLRSFQEASAEEQRQVRWPLWGIVVALGAGALLSMVVLVVVGTGQLGQAESFAAGALAMSKAGVLTWANIINKFFYLLIPISFAFGIVKYRLLEIDVLVRKTLIYAGVTGFVLAAYLVLVGIVGLALVSFAGVENNAMTIAATLLIAALLVPVKNRIQRLVDERWVPRRAGHGEIRRRIEREVIAAVSLPAFLERLVEHAQEALHCRTLVVFVRGLESGPLEAAAQIGLSDEAFEGLVLDPGHPALTAADRVVRTAGLSKEDRGRTLRKVELVAPARLRGELVACLTVGRRLDREPFADDDLTFLAAAADQLALAVGNLRTRRDESERVQAMEIQRSLFPATLPQRPGCALAAAWLPAREVGGDYYDVIELADAELGLCIADVVGKGLPAAIMMSSLQAAVRAVAAQERDPARLAAEVRRVVTRSLTGGRFVTFFYGRLEPGGRLVYTNAGHCPPILVRASGEVERLATGGGVLARLLAGTPFVAGETTLAPGDRLVLFTDGMSEACPAGSVVGSHCFGEDRLVELVCHQAACGAGELLEHLLDAVRDFAGGVFQDDVTVLVVAREAR